jgi:hypothetical protein
MKRKVALAKLSLVLSRLLSEGGFIFVEAIINAEVPSSTDVMSLSLPPFWWAAFMDNHCCVVQPFLDEISLVAKYTLLAMEDTGSCK